MKFYFSKKSLVTFLLLGLGVTTVVGVNQPSQPDVFASQDVVYDFYPQFDSNQVANLPVTTNLSLADDNLAGQSMTLSIGSLIVGTPNEVRLGHNNSTLLSGSSEGQFAYGSPSLLSLATTTNLVSTKRTYGARLTQVVDLTYYKDILITWSWSSGGDGGSYSGFLAYSNSSINEAWEVLGSVQRPMILSTAGSLTYSDIGSDVLMGQAYLKFALIFGSEQSKIALKNIFIKVEGTLKTTVVSVSNPGFLLPNRYRVNEPFIFSDFTFQVNYTDRPLGNTLEVDGLTSGVSLSLNSEFDPLITSGHTFSVADTYLLYFRYVDPTGFGEASSSVEMIVDDILKVLTGIYAVDQSLDPLYRYMTYENSISVYPLYNDAVIPEEGESPLSSSLYSMSIPFGTLLLLQTVNVITYAQELETFTFDLPIDIQSRVGLSLILGGPAFYYLDIPFDVTTLTVSGVFDLGNNTTPTYDSEGSDGTFSTNILDGSYFTEVGLATIIVSYHVNETSLVNSIEMMIEEPPLSMFENILNGTEDWDASITPRYGSIVDEVDSLTNEIDLNQSLDWVLNTVADDPLGDNGRFGLLNEVVRFGHNTPYHGPKEIDIQSVDVVTGNVDENTLCAIQEIRIDLFTQTVGQLTVSVGGISPSHYRINNFNLMYQGSTANTRDNAPGIYIFSFPYPVIGQVTMSYRNDLPQPGYVEWHYFGLFGYSLTEIEKAETLSFMLDDSNSCMATTYDALLPTYQFLEQSNANQYLSQFTLTEHGQITADQLWIILVDRYANVEPLNVESPSSMNTDVMIKSSLGFLILILMAFPFFLKRIDL